MGTASFKSRVKLGGTPTSFTEESVTYDDTIGVEETSATVTVTSSSGSDAEFTVTAIEDYSGAAGNDVSLEINSFDNGELVHFDFDADKFEIDTDEFTDGDVAAQEIVDGINAYDDFEAEVDTEGDFTDTDDSGTTEDFEGGESTGVYQIDDEHKQIWNPDTTIQGDKDDNDLVIEVDDGSGFSEIDYDDIEAINMLFGKFSLKSDIDPDEASDVRVSGEYIPISEGDGDRVDRRIAYCDSYDLTLEYNVHDVTGFREAQITDGNRLREPGLLDSSASLTGFGTIPDDIERAFYDRDTVLLEIIPGNGDEIFRGWFVVETDSLSGDVDGLEESDMSFQLNTRYPESRIPVSLAWSDIVLIA